MKTELKTTTNRSLFNKLYKEAYASCSYCPWHPCKFGKHNDNDNWKGYDISSDFYYSTKKTSYPSWKLTSKNTKQWMPKNIKIYEHINGYTEFVWYVKNKTKKYSYENY